jgi:hypothetical protein
MRPINSSTRVDHLVYAASDLHRGLDEIEALVGVRAAPGGQHLGGGTHNALLGLGPGVYLEIIATDPDQAPPPQPRAFGLDSLSGSRLAAWAVTTTNVDAVLAQAQEKGIKLGEVQQGNRRRADGMQLRWRYTNPRTILANGIVPFFIDWGQSPHPSLSAPTGATLVALRAEHPDEDGVQHMLRALNVDLTVTHAANPALVAVIDGRHGRVELR